MIFQRLIWSALATALLVGTVQTGVQRWQVASLILAAEVFEEQKAPVPNPAQTLADPAHAEMAASHEHEHGAKAWEPENGAERTGWTWVANVLHAFSMALLVFAVMGLWLIRRGTYLASLPLAGLVAAAGWLSFHLWPALGLPAVVPGMDAAPLHARQLWWVLAVASAGLACAVVGFARAPWRWVVSALLLATPFVVGAPQLNGDAFAGYDTTAHTALERLASQFAWATTWVSLSFWGSLGLVGGLVFQRWLRPTLLDQLASDTSPRMVHLGASQ